TISLHTTSSPTPTLTFSATPNDHPNPPTLHLPSPQDNLSPYHIPTYTNPYSSAHSKRPSKSPYFTPTIFSLYRIPTYTNPYSPLRQQTHTHTHTPSHPCLPPSLFSPSPYYIEVNTMSVFSDHFTADHHCAFSFTIPPPDIGAVCSGGKGSYSRVKPLFSHSRPGC
ncbi:hypothetical protein RRG08_019504, partial [Elysia crispata]